MDEPTTDVIQGTLDLLILKTLSLQPMHGFGIARRVEHCRRRLQGQPGFAADCPAAPGARRVARRRVAADGEFAPREVLRADTRWTQTARRRDGGLAPPGERSRAPLERGGLTMSLWRQLSRGLRALTNRRAADAELNDEVLDYLDRTANANIARHDAQRRVSPRVWARPTVTRERVRDAGWRRPRDVDRRRPLRTAAASLEPRLPPSARSRWRSTSGRRR